MSTVTCAQRCKALCVTGIAAFALGVNYTWSVLVQPVSAKQPLWWSGTPVLAQSLMVFASGCTCAFAGKFVNSRGPRFPSVIGAVLFSLAFGLMAVSLQWDQQWLYYVSLVCCLGPSLAFSNVACVQYCLRWHPTNRGFAGGFFGTALGVGAVCLTEIESVVADDIGIVALMLVLGAMGLVMLVPTALLMDFPTEAKPGPAAQKGGGDDAHVKLLNQGKFWLFYIAFTTSLIPGWGFVASFDDIFTSLLSCDRTTASWLTTADIAVYTVFRLVWGALSDRIGYVRSFCIYTCGQAVLLAVLPWVGELSPIAGVVLVFVAVTFFSGAKATYGATAFFLFGPTAAGTAIGWLLTGYGAASLIGGFSCAAAFNATGSYALFFYPMAGVELVGLVATVWLMCLLKNSQDTARPGHTLDDPLLSEDGA